MGGRPVSVAALLAAEACNAGLTPVTGPDNPAPPAGGCRLMDTAIDLAGLSEGEVWVAGVHGGLRHCAPS
jgi:hypothetical protein